MKKTMGIVYRIIEELDSGPISEYVKYRTGKSGNAGAYDQLRKEINVASGEMRKSVQRIEQRRNELDKMVQEMTGLVSLVDSLSTSLNKALDDES